MSAEIAETVDSACPGAEAFFEIAANLERIAGEPDPTNVLAPFVLAFYYDLLESRSERREIYGPYAPIIETDSHSWPPRLETLDPGAERSWATVVQLCSEPAAKARLHDLLWVRRFGNQPYRHAVNASEAYCAQAPRWVDLPKAECLIRALELATEINDQVRIADISSRVVAAVEEALSECPDKPGVSLRLIEALLDLGSSPSAADPLLERAASVYEHNAHISEVVSELRVARAADADERTALRRDQLRRWAAEAERADGLAAVAHLQHGLELARTYGLTEEADGFRRALQAFDVNTIPFERIEAKTEIDSQAIDDMLTSLVGDNWAQSLQIFGATGPPTGDASENESFIKQMMKEHPLSFLFTRVVLGPENTVIKNISGDDAHFTAQLIEHERRQIEFWGQLAAQGLARMAEEHGEPSMQDLTAYFEANLVRAENADAFARGILLFLNERYDECAHVLAPRIESVIRELARNAGLVVIREPIGERPGGVRGLGETLTALRPFLDDSWWRYLWNSLSEPLGLNLRNRLAHGLSTGGPVSCALLLHIACHLRLLRSS